MKGGKKRNSVDPPVPAADGGPKCASVDGTSLPPVDESDEEEQFQRKENHPERAADGDETGADEVDEDDDDDDDPLDGEDGKSGAGDGDEEEEGERPKLDEGFYEIEAVRRKRVRKGEVQYLIKWRGWPETENTWEPLENLLSVSDVIDSFEESLRSGKRSLRRRKRKTGSAQNQIKKKLQQLSPAAATNNVPPVKVRIIEEPPSFTPHCDTGVTNDNGDDAAVVTRGSRQVNGNSGKSTEGTGVQNESDLKLSELKRAANNNEYYVDKFTIDSHEAQVSGQAGIGNGAGNTDCGDMLLSSRCSGARRRKSGSVKRFKQEKNLCRSDDLQNAPLESNTSGSFENQLTQNSDIDSCRKSKINTFKDICDIIEIIRPVSYSASMNSTKDVSVTFMAKRSDGKEVMVDNKFLKSNNPLLLINYYEQNLRYTAA